MVRSFCLGLCTLTSDRIAHRDDLNQYQNTSKLKSTLMTDIPHCRVCNCGADGAAGPSAHLLGARLKGALRRLCIQDADEYNDAEYAEVCSTNGLQDSCWWRMDANIINSLALCTYHF